jgi:DNA polymerase III delta prime subunit
MRKHIFLFFSALLFLYACKGGGDASGVIDRDEMVNLLVDVHLVDGSLSMQPNADSLYKVGTGRYLLVFKQHHTDSAQFKKSMKYYAIQPEIMLKIYDDVNKKLQAKNDSLAMIILKDQQRVVKDQEKVAKQLETINAKKEKTRQDSMLKMIKEHERKIMKENTRKFKLDSIKRSKGIKPKPKNKKIV